MSQASSESAVREVVVLTSEASFCQVLESSLLKAGLPCRVTMAGSVSALQEKIRAERVDAVVIEHRPPQMTVSDTSYLFGFDGPVVGVVPPRFDDAVDERLDAVLVPGDLGRMAVRIAEIAERRRILADVRASDEARMRAEHNLDLIQAQSRTAAIFIDQNGSIESLNGAAAKLFDCGSDEMSGRPIQTLLPDLAIDGGREVGEAGAAGATDEGDRSGADSSAEAWLQKSRRRGAAKGAAAVDVRGFPIPGSGGALLLIDDVADRELAVRAARRRHDLLVQVLPGVTYILRLDAATGRPDRFLWMSPNAEEVLGMSPTPLLQDGTRFLARIPDGERQTFEAAMARGLDLLGTQTAEHRLRTESGDFIWLRHFANPVADRSTGIRAMYGIMLDVTDEARSQNQVDLLARVVDQAANVVIITNADGSIEYVNRAFEEVTGYARAETIGQNPRILQSGRFSRDYYEEMWAHLKAGNPWETLFENRRKDGSTYLQKSTISPVVDRHGTVRYVGIAQDVTRQEALEAEARERRAWSDLGLLAAAIAGDLDSVLRTVSSGLEPVPADEAYEGSPPSTPDEIHTATLRGLALVERLLRGVETAKQGGEVTP